MDFSKIQTVIRITKKDKTCTVQYNEKLKLFYTVINNKKYTLSNYAKVVKSGIVYSTALNNKHNIFTEKEFEIFDDADLNLISKYWTPLKPGLKFKYYIDKGKVVLI